MWGNVGEAEGLRYSTLELRRRAARYSRPGRCFGQWERASGSRASRARASARMYTACNASLKRALAASLLLLDATCVCPLCLPPSVRVHLRELQNSSRIALVWL